MIDRYNVKEIEDYFSLESRYNNFLEVELSVLKAYVRLGVVPEKDYLKIKDTCKVDVDRINYLEKSTKHDVIAFTRSLSENLGPEKRWIHYNLTSTDVVDTALSLTLKQCDEMLIHQLEDFRKTLEKKAIQYKFTFIIGRTHGIHGEVTSFGLKWALYIDELDRDIERFNNERKNVEVVKISGTVGNFANLPFDLQSLVAEDLNLGTPKISTQVLSRDRLAGYVASLCLIASLYEKIATEIRLLSQTEINEVNEFFDKNQKGSSAMPHKRNPIGCENICGLARIVKASYSIALDNNDLWHERDISHSSTERLYLPDDIDLISYMTSRLNNIVKNLVVNEEQMIKNINSTYGVIYSGRVMNYIIDNSTISREEIYDHIQKMAFQAMDEKVNLKELMLKDEYILSMINKDEINNLFNYKYVFKNVDKIYKEVGI
ncbi:MAG: adenylosuccinate lyase [Bacilli bacterium]